MQYETRYIKVNGGITLHVVFAGPEDGVPVLLLHGFPEFWYGWRHQIDALAAQGYRVIVPDQRGYHLSDKPKDVRSYSLDALRDDVTGLMDALDYDKVRLVGHDWGGAVAWWTAITQPARLHKLVILNLPHPAVFIRTLRNNFEQLRKSWYFGFFQLPGLPEAMLSPNDFRAMARAVVASAKPTTFSEDDLARYREAWGKPGALRAMINWYRAAVRHRPKSPSDIRVHMPTLLIWGAGDTALSVTMAQPSIDLCDDGRLEIIEDATHWVQHDAAERVNALLADFLAN